MAMPAAVSPNGVAIAMITVQRATCFQVIMFATAPTVGQAGGSGNVGSAEGRAVAGGKGSTPAL